MATLRQCFLTFPSGPTQTVDRIIDQFPADRQNQIRTMLSESLKGVISQNLLKKIGGGRVAAMEVLIVTAAISNLIREGKTFQIPSLMQTGKKQGMILLNDALLGLLAVILVLALAAGARVRTARLVATLKHPPPPSARPDMTGAPLSRFCPSS